MILSEIQSFIRQRRAVSLLDLQMRFRMSPTALRDAVGLLERKGRVKKVIPSSGCGGCSGGACGGCSMEFIEWVGGTL